MISKRLGCSGVVDLISTGEFCPGGELCAGEEFCACAGPVRTSARTAPDSVTHPFRVAMRASSQTAIREASESPVCEPRGQTLAFLDQVLGEPTDGRRAARIWIDRRSRPKAVGRPAAPMIGAPPGTMCPRMPRPPIRAHSYEGHAPALHRPAEAPVALPGAR